MFKTGWKLGYRSVLVSCLILFSVSAIEAQAVWHVTTIDDNDDGNCNAGHCSLREAINAANLNMGPDSIVFDIPGAGPYTIMPLSPLPAIQDSFLVIDGTHQPGNFPMAGLIRIDGSNLVGPAMHGLVIYVRHVRIYGLQIQRFQGDGIQIFGGFLDDPFISNITIGAPNKGNVIIQNGAYGIEADVDSNFLFHGNFIGTNLAFAPGLGNANDGLYARILTGKGSQIGGNASSSDANYFCSNTFTGLHLFVQDASVLDPGFRVTGNRIGTGMIGDEQLGNSGFTFAGNQIGGGILIDGDNGAMQIGGINPNQWNTLAYNFNGIVINGTNFKSILGNSFYCNINEGISLLNGGNENLMSPYALCTSGNTLAGYADPGCDIQVYRISPEVCPGGCQGFDLVGTTMSAGDGSWSLGSVNPAETLVATATNAGGSTSPFSLCLGADTLSLLATNNGPICEGDFAALSATPSRILPGISYTWTGPNGFTASTQNPANATEAGTYTAYVYIGDCVKDSAITQVEVLQHGRDTITDFCLGDSWTINGNTYNFMNTDGVEVIPGAAANGCDSIVVFDMNLNPSILGMVNVPQYACAGDMITLQFEMIPLNGPYQIVYRTGASLDTLNGVFDGHQIEIPIQATTIFQVVDINTNLTICEPIIGGPDTVFVSDIQADPQLSDYNGFGVTCPYLADGTIDLTYTGAISPASITWGDTTLTDSLRTDLEPGIYFATISDVSGCEQALSIDLESPEPLAPDIDPVATSCYGAVDGMIVIQDVLHAQGTVTGSLDSSFFFQINGYPFEMEDLEAGTYLLDLEDSAGCAYQYNVTVPSGPMAPISIGPDQRIARGDSIFLEIDMNFPPVVISWEPAIYLSCTSCPNPVATPEVTSTFSVTVTDSEGCISEDAMTIDVFIPQNVFIANVFSPNFDGINDDFYIQGNDSVVECLQMRIFDRWGTVLFERTNFQPNDPTQGWDGLVNGELANPGVYTYVVEIAFIENQVRWLSGTVTLVR